ncbi:hypothetical protein ACO0QE_001084 [Hanseniaspora vineae]
MPTVLQQVRDFIDKYDNHVVLTQVGSFYELYFEQATLYAGKLNLTLTSKKYTCGVIPFAGFPSSQLSKYVKILVKDYGHSVVIVDQYKKVNAVESPEENDTSSKEYDISSLKVVRRVSRIVTPGTLLDEAFENLASSTFLLNVEFPSTALEKPVDLDTKLGISWTDISTGEIYVQRVYLKELVSAITRIKPSEILLDSRLAKYHIKNGEWFPELVELKKYFLSYYMKPSRHRTFDTFKHLFSINDHKRYHIFINSIDSWEGTALRNLLTYVEEHLPECSTNLQIPERKSSNEIMQIDSRTSAALELHSTVRTNSVRGSLLSVIRRTVTTSGTRLLSQWISAPLLNVEEIRFRQNIVEFFSENYSITAAIVETYLKKIYDVTKILQKFSMNKGSYVELLQLSHSLKSTKSLRDFLVSKALPVSKDPEQFKEIIQSIQVNDSLVSEVLESIDEDKIVTFMEKHEASSSLDKSENGSSSSSLGYQSLSQAKLNNRELLTQDWYIKPKASSKLKRLHRQFESLAKEYDEMYASLYSKLIEKLGFKNIEFKISLSNGFVLQINGPATIWKKFSNFAKISPHLEFIQGKSTKKIFQFEPWTTLGHKLEHTIFQIREEEESIMENFKKRFIGDSYALRKTAGVLDYLDVLTSFAKLTVEKNLVRPTIDDSKNIEIYQGKHIVVEDGLLNNMAKRFTANDCNLTDNDGTKTWIVTGPNMGGKSTFLRQNAIIVILAQIGCFVPCEHCKIGIVDKIFSRVGSADDLYNEMSTFMVEMIETNYILQGATERSLAILDEVGRGTNGREGVAIAYGTLKHLVTKNKCKTLFATHFGKELQNMIEPSDESLIGFYKTDLIMSENKKSEQENFRFSKYDHRLKPGICTKSDALKVAYEAGFPEYALAYAKEALKNTEK